jgi:hypothetical protein
MQAMVVLISKRCKIELKVARAIYEEEDTETLITLARK